MSTTFLPCGDYHQNYAQEHAWWQTKFIKGKMILLFLFLFVFIHQAIGFGQKGVEVPGALRVKPGNADAE